MEQVGVILKLVDELTAPLSSAVSNAESSLNSLQNGTSKAVGGIAGFFGGAMGKITGFIGGLIDQASIASAVLSGPVLNALNGVIESAANFQRFGKAAEFLTGSTVEAKKFALSMREIGLESMFSMEQVASLGTKLVGQTKDVDKSSKAMKILVDAVAATGGGYMELDGATRAYIQTNAKAVASSEELNRQFSNANIPIIRLLAESVVKDLNSPLRAYIQTAGDAGGASKKLTADYAKANDILGDSSWKLKELEANLNKVKGAHGDNAWETEKARDKYEDYKATLDKARGTVEKFNDTANNTTTSFKKANLTVKDVMAALQEVGDLKIPGEVMGDAILKALEKSYGGATQKMVRTFSYQMEQLKDRTKLAAQAFLGLSEDWGTVSGGILDRLTGGIQSLNSWLDQNQKTIEGWGKSIANTLPFLTTVGGLLAGLLLPMVLRFVVALVAMIGIWGVIGFVAGIVIEKMGGMHVIFEKVSELVSTVQGKFASFYPVIERLTQILGKGFYDAGVKFTEFIYKLSQHKDPPYPLSWKDAPAVLQGAVIKPLTDQLQKFKNFLAFGLVDSDTNASWMQAFQGLSQSIQTAFQNIRNFVTPIIETIIGIFKKVVSFVMTTFAPLWSTMASQFQPTIDALKLAMLPALQQLGEAMIAIAPLVKMLLVVLAGLLAGIITIAVAIVAGIVNALAYVMPYVVQVFTAVMTFITGIMNIITGIFTLNLGLILEGVIQTFTGMYNFVFWAFGAIVALVKGFVVGVIKFFQGLYDALIGHSIIPDMVMGIIDWFAKLWDDGVAYVKAMVKSLIDHFNLLKNNAISAISGLVSSIAGKISEMVGSAYNWGRDLVSNFVNGIKNALKSLGSIASTIASKMGLGDLKFDHGGIVPGPVGAPALATVHGGERIVPRSGVDDMGGGGGTTINFYGDVAMDSDERVAELADKIGKILGRQNELARYGSGY